MCIKMKYRGLKSIILVLIVGVYCENGEASPIQSIVALQESLEVQKRFTSSINIEGDVWWSSPSQGRIILKDADGIAHLEVHLSSPMPKVGDRVAIQGECLIVQSRDVIKLISVPVVDHDGLHENYTKSGSCHLEKGYHPIRLMWFDRTDREYLSLAYEGAGLARQTIPDEILFCRASNEQDLNQYRSGIRYHLWESQWWRLLPNFHRLPAKESGIANNFDIKVRSRDDHVGIMFSGYIKIDNDGLYTFYLNSDDGSRLFIGEETFHISKVGESIFPPEISVQHLSKSEMESEFEWLEFEGDIVAIHEENGVQNIDLKTHDGMVRLYVIAEVAEDIKAHIHNRIRVAGVGRRASNSSGIDVLGEVFIQSWDCIELTAVSSDLIALYPIVNIQEVMDMAVMPGDSIKVRMKGQLVFDQNNGGMYLQDSSGHIDLERFSGDITLTNKGVHILCNVKGEKVGKTIHPFHILSAGEFRMNNRRLPLLTQANEVRSLTYEEASKGFPVCIRGVITGALDHNGAVIYDGTQGIYITSGDPPMLQVGDYCEVIGITKPFGFDPEIIFYSINKLGK